MKTVIILRLVRTKTVFYKLVHKKNMGKIVRVTDSITILLEQFLILITCAGDSLTGNLLYVGSAPGSYT